VLESLEDGDDGAIVMEAQTSRHENVGFPSSCWVPATRQTRCICTSSMKEGKTKDLVYKELRVIEQMEGLERLKPWTVDRTW
jgi:hypothetical protein